MGPAAGEKTSNFDKAALGKEVVARAIAQGKMSAAAAVANGELTASEAEILLKLIAKARKSRAKTTSSNDQPGKTSPNDQPGKTSPNDQPGKTSPLGSTQVVAQTASECSEHLEESSGEASSAVKYPCSAEWLDIGDYQNMNQPQPNTNLIDLTLAREHEEFKFKSRRVDYKNYNNSFLGARYVFECGYKLKANPITIATAASLFHQFFREFDANTYDRYLIGATCLYIAGKMRDESYKLRDVVNVAHATLHRGSSPLDLKEEYWVRRDAIVQAELLIMRALRFNLQVPTTHKFLLHYLVSLKSWLSKTIWESTPICQASFSFLQDFYHDPAVLDYKPQLVAISCMYLAMQCYGVDVPGMKESDDSSWFDVFSKERKEDVWNVVELIMDNYNREGSY